MWMDISKEDIFSLTETILLANSKTVFCMVWENTEMFLILLFDMENGKKVFLFEHSILFKFVNK